MSVIGPRDPEREAARIAELDRERRELVESAMSRRSGPIFAQPSIIDMIVAIGGFDHLCPGGSSLAVVDAPSGRGFSFADLRFETTAWLGIQDSNRRIRPRAT
jgi:hypothetical protein